MCGTTYIYNIYVCTPKCVYLIKQGNNHCRNQGITKKKTVKDKPDAINEMTQKIKQQYQQIGYTATITITNR